MIQKEGNSMPEFKVNSNIICESFAGLWKVYSSKSRENEILWAGLQQIYFLKVSNKIKSTTIGGGLVEVKIGTFSQFEKHDSNSKV